MLINLTQHLVTNYLSVLLWMFFNVDVIGSRHGEHVLPLSGSLHYVHCTWIYVRFMSKAFEVEGVEYTRFRVIVKIIANKEGGKKKANKFVKACSHHRRRIAILSSLRSLSSSCTSGSVTHALIRSRTEIHR